MGSWFATLGGLLGEPKKPPRPPRNPAEAPEAPRKTPRDLVETPQTSQGPPRRPQEPSKRLPTDPQEASRASPRHPRNPPDAPRGLQNKSILLPALLDYMYTHPSPRQLSWASFLDGLVGTREASRISVFLCCVSWNVDPHANHVFLEHICEPLACLQSLSHCPASPLLPGRPDHGRQRGGRGAPPEPCPRWRPPRGRAWPDPGPSPWTWNCP